MSMVHHQQPTKKSWLSTLF